MNRYVAFLRAINVGGRVVRMDQLRRLFEAAGFSGVQTFIASGNVIFESRSRSAAALERKIEAALRSTLGYEVVTFLRSASQVSAIAAFDPFARSGAAAPGASTYIGFMRAPLPVDIEEKLRGLGTDTDEFAAHDRELYWLRRIRSMESLRLMSRLDRTIGAPITVRNATTVRRIADVLNLRPDPSS